MKLLGILFQITKQWLEKMSIVEFNAGLDSYMLNWILMQERQ